MGAAGCSEMGETESCSWRTSCVWTDAFVRRGMGGGGGGFWGLRK